METTFFSFLNKEKDGRQAIGAVVYRQEGSTFNGSLLHDFELLVLVICETVEPSDNYIEHFMNGTTQYQMRYIGREELKQWAMAGDHREMVRCFLHGEIIWDVMGELALLRRELNHFGDRVREARKLQEFAKFLRTYVEAKQFARERDFLDAYYSGIQALKHYARIELIDHGLAPENCLWEQLRDMNTVVHKLFNELTDNKETLEQRIELVLLACDFFVISRMEDCCSILLKLLGSRREAWSIKELIARPELAHVKEELPMVIRKLVYRSLVKQTAYSRGERYGDSREIRYWA